MTFSAPDDWNDHKKLYNWAFSQYSDREVTDGVDFEIPVVSGTAPSVKAVPEKLRLFLPRSAELSLVADMPFFVFAPVKAGEQAGTVSVMLGGEKIAETRLVYAESVSTAAFAGNFTPILEPMR